MAVPVVGAAYGGVIGLTRHEFGWGAVGVGFLIGLVAGRTGRSRNPLLGVISAVLALGSACLGQLTGEALLIAKDVHLGITQVFFENFGLVRSVWETDLGPMSFLFLALAAITAYSTTRKAAQ